MPTDPTQPQVTRILLEWRSGDHTLQATALVHEAYARLVDAEVAWSDRAHFFAVAARTMRRILVDHARARLRAKRGGDLLRVTLDERWVGDERAGMDVLALDEALERLRALDERKHQLVELSYFAGLTHEEAAEVAGVSLATVKCDLTTARAWLGTQLKKGPGT